MSTLPSLVFAVLILVGSAPYAAPNAALEGAALEDRKEVTVSGTLVDTKCYGMNHDNVANEHTVPMADGKMGSMPNCATACANMGIPVGLLKDGKKDGDVFVLIVPSNALADRMAKEARVTGTLAYEGGIIPGKIEVKGADGWEEVAVATMM